jgi:dihydrofolate reductase
VETPDREDRVMPTAKLTLDISMSLDGFVAGPNQTLDQPLGEGGERLHEWVIRLASWRERHGLSGGEANPDDEVVAESLRATGAVVMGRRMFSGGDGPWADDPRADGWWGDEPPFHVPVFVLTHHARDTVIKQGGTSFTFVTDGIEAALEQARAAADDKDVLLAGGASVAQQYLKAGLLDELQIHLVPVLLGGGVRLFDGLGPETIEIEATRVIPSEAVTHLRFRVVR